MLNSKQLLFISRLLIVVLGYILSCLAGIAQETEKKEGVHATALVFSYSFHQPLSSKWERTSRGDIGIYRFGHRISGGVDIFEQTGKVLFCPGSPFEGEVCLSGIYEHGKKDIGLVERYPTFTESALKGIFLTFKAMVYPYHSQRFWIGLGTGYGGGYIGEELNVYLTRNGHNINIYENTRDGFGIESPALYLSLVFLRNRKPALGCQLGIRGVGGFNTGRSYIEDEGSFWPGTSDSFALGIFLELRVIPLFIGKYNF